MQVPLTPTDLLPVAAVVWLPVEIIRLGRGTMARVVHQWGLFPPSDLSAPVLLSAVGSATGLGVRLLSWSELAALWDVPILISDRLSEATDTTLLCRFCLLAPTKVLFVGVDALLTKLFRGGGGGSISSLAGIGPAPNTDAELGLVVMLDDVPPVRSLTAQVQVIKGDTQKANGAAVSDHLWIYAFLCGYGLDGHRPRHLRALDLAPTASIGGMSNSSPTEGWEATASGLSTLALFRSLVLHLWRRQVLCGFFAWRRHNIRITRGCNPGPMMHPLLDSHGGEGRVRLRWSPKGKAA